MNITGLRNGSCSKALTPCLGPQEKSLASLPPLSVSFILSLSLSLAVTWGPGRTELIDNIFTRKVEITDPKEKISRTGQDKSPSRYLDQE
jgi:hypothetical protein